MRIVSNGKFTVLVPTTGLSLVPIVICEIQYFTIPDIHMHLIVVWLLLARYLPYIFLFTTVLKIEYTKCFTIFVHSHVVFIICAIVFIVADAEAYAHRYRYNNGCVTYDIVCVPPVCSFISEASAMKFSGTMYTIE